MPKMVHKQVWQKLHIFQNISQTGPTKTYDTVLSLSRYKYLPWANIFYHIICAYTAYMERVWVLQLCTCHSTSNIWPHKLLQNSKHLKHILPHCRITFAKYINYNTVLDSDSSTWSTVCQQNFQCSALVNCSSSL
jgi:hypothetical protein